jgi:FtsH-binding integral membrane protein
MSYAMAPSVVADQADVGVRAAFIRKTYAHVAGALIAFVALEALFLRYLPDRFIGSMMSGYGPLVVLGAFMFVGWIADRWASSGASPAVQYLGLGLYVAAEAFLFVPLIYVAAFYSSPQLLPSAAVLTLAMFAGLTVVVLSTGKDFSFLRAGLSLGSLVAFGLIVASILFGFNLVTIFAVGMVGLASGYILYYTSQILHHYQTDQHVAASLALFAAVALLFWYVLRIFLSSRD